MEKVLHHPKFLNNRVTPERAPYNPTLYSYAIIPLRIMPRGSLRRRLRIIGSFPIMSFSHGEECHRVPTEQVPYNPKLMNNRVTTAATPCHSTFSFRALIPWRGLPIGLVRRRLRILGRFTIMRFFPIKGNACRVPTENVPYNLKLL